MLSNLDVSTNPNNVNCKHLEIKNLNQNLREIQRLYINWNLDPGYKKTLEEWELKYGLHDWAIWRTKINENLILTSLFNTPFILNQNNKSFVSQNQSNDITNKDNNDAIQARLVSLSNENFSDLNNFNFQIDPSVARFIYYYGFTKQKPLIDPESYMFYGIPRIKLDILSKKDHISENINTVIVNAKDQDEFCQFSMKNEKNCELDVPITKIETEDLKNSFKQKIDFPENQDNNLKLEIKNSTNSSIKRHESYRMSSHPPKQLTIQTNDDQNKLSKPNSIRSNRSDFKLNSVNSSLKNAAIVTPSTPNRNLNRNNIFSNCPTSIKAELKALRTNSEPAPIITGINVKEKVKAFESVAENNINKSTPIKGDSNKNLLEKKNTNDMKDIKMNTNINLFDTKKSWSIIKNSRNVSLEKNSNENNKLLANNEKIEQNQQKEHIQNKNDDLPHTNMNIRNNSVTFVSTHQTLVY